jgi:hypothetical protein
MRYIHGHMRVSPQMAEWIRKQKQEEREEYEAAYFHDQEPGRWGDHASPARMRRECMKDREEDRQYE